MLSDHASHALSLLALLAAPQPSLLLMLLVMLLMEQAVVLLLQTVLALLMLMLEAVVQWPGALWWTQTAQVACLACLAPTV